MKQPRFDKKISTNVFWQPKGSFHSEKKKSNVKISIFVAICGKIQYHFDTSTFKTEIKTWLRFDVLLVYTKIVKNASLCSMAIPLMEFQVQWYKISKLLVYLMNLP